jgi:gliding motility-associated-like protein
MGRKIDQIAKYCYNLCALMLWGGMGLFCHFSVAQNLIYNPGAEVWNDTTLFRMWGNEFYTPNCDGWFYNLPDNVHRFGGALLDNQSPAMLIYKDLNQFETHTGQGTFHVFVGLSRIPNNHASSNRPFLQTRLLDTLQEGCFYELSYAIRPFHTMGLFANPHLILQNNGWSVCKNVGFWFTQGRVRDTLSAWGLEFSTHNPQPQVRLPQDYYITDTTQFTQLSSIFQAAGGETHLTIGNFWHPDSSIFYHLWTGQLIPHHPTSLYTGNYYFLDDISLVLVPPPDSVLKTTRDTVICTGDSLRLYASGAHAQWYQWSTGSTDSSIVITQPGIYWVTCGFNCGFSLSDTIHVSSLADQPPALASQDTVICPGDQVELFAPWSDAIQYLWHNGSTDSSIVIHQPGQYWVEALVPCGHTRRFEISVTPYPELPDLIFPEDTTICKGTRFQFPLVPGPQYLLNDQPLSEPELSIGQEGAFTITARNRCFETQSFFALSTEACETKVWMPNTFTPNGDGLNDCVAPVLVNVVEQDYHFIITDRWGNVVFETTEHHACWDGTFQGQKIAGIYTWRLTYRGLQTGYGTAQGFVQVYL